MGCGASSGPKVYKEDPKGHHHVEENLEDSCEHIKEAAARDGSISTTTTIDTINSTTEGEQGTEGKESSAPEAGESVVVNATTKNHGDAATASGQGTVGEKSSAPKKVEGALHNATGENLFGWKKFESVHVEFVGITGESSVTGVGATADTTIGKLRTHVRSQLRDVDVVLCSGATVFSSDEKKLSEYTVPSEAGTVTLNCILRSGGPTDDDVIAEPGRYRHAFSGHVRPDCNGLYTYGGKENGKCVWTKPGSKVFWTFWGGRGHTWDIYWGGVSPENKSDTPIPPRSGWDGQGQAANSIKISYVRAWPMAKMPTA